MTDRTKELEATLANNPDDAAAWSVYADLLQAANDPRGELIALSLAGKDTADYFAKHEATFLGALAKHQKTYDGNSATAFTWRNGFLRSANLSHNYYAEKLEGGLLEMFKTLLAHPSAKFLTDLTMTFNNDPNEDNLQTLIDHLAEVERPMIRSLFFGDFQYCGAVHDERQGEETEISWYSVGNLSNLWRAVPNLRSLIIQSGSAESALSGGTTLGALELPKLTHFEYRTGGFEDSNMQSIVDAKWPAIEFLDVWTGQASYGCTTNAEQVTALLARKDMPHLTHLGIMNCEFVDDVIEAIAKSPLLPKLKELDLSLGCLTDAGVALLDKHRDKFAHLELLDVSFNNIGDAAPLKGIAKEVRDENQRDVDDDRRYAAVGE